MGKENDVMLDYLDDEERFADLFNGNLFQGEQIVKAEELTEGSEIYVEEYQEMPGKGMPDGKTKGRQRIKTATRTRDVKKRLRSGGVLRVLAIENQNQVNYAMPWRHMNYDCLEYGKQIRCFGKKNRKADLLKTSAEKLCGLRKEDRLAPTYTICVYHGMEKWDGPRSLKDMMEFGEDGERWAELFSDYRMHLVCINEITDFSKYHSPLREFFQLLACREDEEALKRLLSENPLFQRMDAETAKAANVLMGSEIFMGRKNEGEETYNMCGALTAIKNEGKMEGKMEGKNEGMDILNRLYGMLVRDGRMADLMRAIEDKRYREHLLVEYDFSEKTK